MQITEMWNLDYTPYRNSGDCIFDTNAFVEGHGPYFNWKSVGKS